MVLLGDMERAKLVWNGEKIIPVKEKKVNIKIVDSSYCIYHRIVCLCQTIICMFLCI